MVVPFTVFDALRPKASYVKVATEPLEEDRLAAIAALSDMSGSISRGRRAMLQRTNRFVSPEFPSVFSPEGTSGVWARTYFGNWFVSPEFMRRLGIIPILAQRRTAHGSGLGIFRWVVERTFAWLHQFRRLRVRDE